MCPLVSILSIFVGVLFPVHRFEFVSNETTPAARWFDQLNVELQQLNHEAALHGWEASTAAAPTPAELVEKISQLTVRKAHWERAMCARGQPFGDFNASLDRALHLLCRGWVNSDGEMREMTATLGYMQAIYTGTRICVDSAYDACGGGDGEALWENTYFRFPDFNSSGVDEIAGKGNGEVKEVCLYGEPDMERIMNRVSHPIELMETRGHPNNQLLRARRPCVSIKATTINRFSKRPNCTIDEEPILRWAWRSWRLASGPPIKSAYKKLVGLMNAGARRSGFRDAGDAWRAELEMPNLRETVQRLWLEVKPLYEKFHAVLRHFLKKRYPDLEGFERSGMIPAHILGDMWSQNWASYAELVLPHEVDIEGAFRRANWTGEKMVKHADDFYSSMGLPMMTKIFWERSIFAKGENVTKCHGTAANMYEAGDYRMIVCAESSMSDHYVIMHEMGHIIYYMLASNQPTIFQDGTNSAFQEAIGDTIHLASLSPLHLTRIGLLDSSHLKPDIGTAMNSFDYTLLMHTALTKIPALPFAYVMDRYRWDLFDGTIDFDADANRYFWYLLETEQGIKPPSVQDRSDLFDAAAKYHFPDNTPYVRYFLANILSFQLLEGLCRRSIFGSVDSRHHELPMPLHRCDLYGSKRVGKTLQKALSLGGSQPWPVVLRAMTGAEEISTSAMMEYFRPLTAFVDKLIERLEIPVGW